MQAHTNEDTDATQLAWRIDAWLKATGNPFQRPTLYREIRAGRIAMRKAGKRTLITTPPKQYLESLPTEIGPPIRGRRAKRAA